MVCLHACGSALSHSLAGEDPPAPAMDDTQNRVAGRSWSPPRVLGPRLGGRSVGLAENPSDLTKVC